MAKAVRIHEHGGPEVLRYEEVELAPPGPGDVRLRQTAVGLNFIDVYHRTGYYPVGDLPQALGREAVGVVEATGDGAPFSVGERVGYPMHPGAYVDARNVPATALVAIPEDIDDRTAAAVLLKGLTAHYLVRRTYRVAAGDTILVHAAAGGVGSLLVTWAKHLGATVIGTVGNDEKAARATRLGCDRVVVLGRESFVERVRDVTDGRGVPVVYDSVGRDTFAESLDCLAPLGTLVTFGQSSGPVPPLDVTELSRKGSLFLTRPTLATYIARREDLDAAATELFEAVRRGAVSVDVGQTYALADAETAHRDLEARRTVGSTLLLP